MSTLDPGTSLTKRLAIVVFLFRCPRPKPSCEYMRSLIGSIDSFACFLMAI